MMKTLQWRHNGPDCVSNHLPHDCLLKRSFRRRSKKTSKLRVTGLCTGIHRRSVNSPHKGPVTRKMFPIDDVIMIWMCFYASRNKSARQRWDPCWPLIKLLEGHQVPVWNGWRLPEVLKPWLEPTVKAAEWWTECLSLCLAEFKG